MRLNSSKASIRKSRRRGRGNQEHAANLHEELRAYGGTLFDELVPRELQTILWQHRDKLKGLQVKSDEPIIPWELLHLKEPGNRLPEETLFLGQLGMVRCNPNAVLPSGLRIRPGRVRYVIPDYPLPELKLPAGETEKKFLEATWQATRVRAASKEVRELLQGNRVKLSIPPRYANTSGMSSKVERSMARCGTVLAVVTV